MQEELDAEELDGGFPTGAIVGIALAAGAVAFLISRSRRGQEAASPPPPADLDLRDWTVATAREIVGAQVVPQLKPVLLDLVSEARGFFDRVFQRLERAIRTL